MNGFFEFHREVLELDWWRDTSRLTRNLWVELMARANWAPGTTSRGLRLQPGELVTSWERLALSLASTEELKRETPHVSKVRRAAKFLRSAGEVTWVTAPHATGGGLLITLTRWALYKGWIGDATEVATGEPTGGGVAHPTPLEEVQGSVGSRAKTWLQRSTERWLREEREGREAVEEEKRIQQGREVCH